MVTELPKRPRGRPNLYSPEVHAKLVDAARIGMFRRLQAMHAGIAHTTLESWLADARKNPETSLYVHLLGDLESAEADRAFLALSDVQSGGQGWQSAAWYMERKYPSEYGRRVQEIQGKDGSELKFSVTWPTAKANEGGDA